MSMDHIWYPLVAKERITVVNLYDAELYARGCVKWMNVQSVSIFRWRSMPVYEPSAEWNSQAYSGVNIVSFLKVS